MNTPTLDESIKRLEENLGKEKAHKVFREFNETYTMNHENSRTKNYYRYLFEKEKALDKYVDVYLNTNGNLGLM
jgi:hypothetical protein